MCRKPGSGNGPEPAQQGNSWRGTIPTEEAIMVSTKQLADFGYKAFSGSMMLLTAYGGYLCSIRAYRYFQRKSTLKQLEQQEINAEAVKD